MSRRFVMTLALGALFASMLAGTASGAPGDLTATRVADINPGATDSFPDDLINVNGTVFFRADDGTNGEELWKSDGTSATMVEDAVPGGGINPGSGNADPQNFTNVNGTLFFAADDGTNGLELWKSVAPYTTATMVEDAVPGGGINPGSASSAPTSLTNVDGTLFFSADDGTNGEELWKTDGGTAAIVEDPVPGGGIAPGAAGSFVSDLTNINGTLFFSADDGTNGTELWQCDPPYQTATIVEDAVPGGGINPAGNSFPSAVTNVNGTLFFSANDGTNGDELWKTDGTTAALVEDAVAGGGINPGGANSFPGDPTNVDGTLFFTADDGTNGRELWKGVAPYTTATMVEDAVADGGIAPGALNSASLNLINVNGTLFFSADDATNGQELWTIDGTIATMVEDAVAGGGINPGDGSFPSRLTNVNGTLFFRADDGTNGQELWNSEGTTAAIVEDAVPGGGITPGVAGSFLSDLTNVNGTLFFTANDGTNGFELWRIAGTTAALVEDAVPGGGINPGVADSSPDQLTNVNGTLFFSANDGTTGEEPWRTTIEGSPPQVNPITPVTPVTPPTTPPPTKKKKCKKAKKGAAAAKKCKRKRKK